MERDIKAITPVKIIVITLILIILVIAFYLLLPKKPLKVEKTPELIHLTFENTINNHILFSNIKIFKQDDSFYLTAKATNMTSNQLKISPVTFTLIDKNNEKTTLTSYIGNVLTSEEEKSITIQTNKNLKNIKDIDINIQAQV